MAEPENLRRRRLAFLKRKKAKSQASAMSMMGHLDELRTRLIRSAIAFVLVSIVAFMFFNEITDVLLRPLCTLPEDRLGPQGCNLVFFGALEPISVRLKVTAMAGLILASPVWLYQLWAFVVPGLTPEEKKYAFPFVGSSVALFAIGATFAYLTLPAGLRFLVGLGGDNFVPFFRAAEYLNFVSLILIVFGITFELPLLIFFLGLVGIVSVQQLKGFRRAALVGITALSAVVTPSQDPYTMLAMAVPIYLFYEGAILALRLVERRRARSAN